MVLLFFLLTAAHLAAAIYAQRRAGPRGPSSAVCATSLGLVTRVGRCGNSCSVRQ